MRKFVGEGTFGRLKSPRMEGLMLLDMLSEAIK